MHPLDIAAGQEGVAHRSQLLRGGLSDDAVFRLVKKGELLPLLRSVYRVRGAPRTWLQLATAVSLWAGEGSALTGSGAAAIYGLDGYPRRGPFDVVTTRSLRSPRADVRIRRVGTLPIEDVRELRGARVVAPPRLLLDLATALNAQQLEKALEAILRQGLAKETDIVARIEVVPTGTAGLARCKEMLRGRHLASVPTASDLETECLQGLRRCGIPDPVRQHWICDGQRKIGRIDLAYPDAQLGIEVDSYAWHGDFTSFHRDRERYNSVVALGWRLLLYTKRTDRDVFAHQVATILNERQGLLF